MSGPTKTFGLQGPRDLLKKLEIHVEAIESLKTPDTQALAFTAFDCAVSAWCLRDWCWRWLVGAKRTDLGTKMADFEKLLHAGIPDLAVCSQLADGAKHFELFPHKDDASIVSRVSAPPIPFRAGEGRAGDPLVAHYCMAKIDTAAGSRRAPEFFRKVFRDWRKFLDAKAIDVRP